MRNFIVFVLIAFFVIPTSPSFSQDATVEEESLKLRKWLPSTIGIRMGGYEDHYQNLTLQGLQSMIGNQANLQDLLDEGFGEEYFTALTGTNIGLQFSLNPFSRKKDRFNQNHELRLGVSMNTNRESMLVYQREAFDTQFNYSYQEEIIYCLIENEVLIEASYLFRKPLGQKFSIYGGFGANYGSTYGNELLIIESLSEEPISESPNYEAANSSYFRFLMQAGMQVQVFKKMGMYLEFQGGDGVQIVHGGENNSLENCATFFGLNYDLGPF